MTEPDRTESFDVVIVGSGPVGSTFARVITDSLPSARVLLVESGPLLAQPPGRHVKTIVDPVEREHAQLASQGPQQELGTFVGAVMAAEAAARGEEQPIIARPGTWLVGPDAVQPGEQGMPAAAMSSNVGGMGAHWTCASPRPGDGERTTVIDRATLDEAYLVAESLLHVTQTAFQGAPLGSEVRATLRGHLDSRRPAHRGVQPMPLAIRVSPDGAKRWTGPDVILGHLAIEGADGFELRPETVAVRIAHRDGEADGVVLHHRPSGRTYTVDARVVVVAADPFRTPQLLHASGIRPPALGHYLNDQPQAGGTVRLDDRFRPTDDRTHATVSDEIDMLSGVSWIPYDEASGFPFHGQVMQRDSSPVALADGVEAWPGSIVEVGLFAAKDIRYDDRVEFDDERLDSFGLPAVKIHYNLTDRDRESIAEMLRLIAELSGYLGSPINGHPPVVFPNGNSIHYQGTVRMGAVDDGTSVCDEHSLVWGTGNVYVGGNGVIPTATACNPTLTSVALAVHAARHIVGRLADVASVAR